MAFNEIGFLFVFFPLVIALHALMPMRGRNLLLALASLVFFAWGSPEYVLLMVLIVLYNYFSGLQISQCREEGRDAAAKRVLAVSVGMNLLLLGFFKYWGFLLENFNGLFGTSLPVRSLPMPVGVSFFTFSVLSYLFDVYRDKAPAQRNLISFTLFVTFFPKLVSGPIVPYAAMEEQIRQRKLTRSKFGTGSRRFLIGLSKKVLLANTLGNTFYAISALEAGELSALSAWVGALSYALMLYFDFSGYSDMAIGLAEMFGFRFEKNFDYPYCSVSITDFWRRWHVSLGAWFRDYVYIPLGGSRAGTAKTIRNLAVVWLLTGIWHGANWTFVVWGIYYGVLLVLEKFVLRSALERLPTALRRVLTLFVVLIGWVFFFSPTLGSACSWLGSMFGLGSGGWIDAAGRYYLSGSWKILLIAAVGSCPLPAILGSNVYRGRPLPVYWSVLWFAGLLVLCIAGMMVSTYSTFLYFQF